MLDGRNDRLAALLEELRAEFPRFRIIRKDESRFQRTLHLALVAVTLGRMRDYLDGYHTTIGQRIYVTSDWDDRDPDQRYLTLCHERVHMRQFRRFTFPGMTLLYLLLPLPMGAAYFRARFERQAYEVTIRETAAVFGPDHVAAPAFRDRIIEQFTGPSYGWMWPFRKRLESWYDSVLDALPGA